MKPYYQRDGVTLYHGDCLDCLNEVSGLGAVITDPPYSSGGAFRGDRMLSTIAKYTNGDTLAYRTEFAGDTRDQRGFLVWCTLWLGLARARATAGARVLSFTDWRQLPTLSDAIQCAGWVWRGIATWHKPGIRMQRGSFSGSAEYVVWGTNGPLTDHDGAPQNVFACAPVADKVHIAEKPVSVAFWLLKAIEPGVLVVDPFMGTGSILQAARISGHPCVGIDIDERYCEIAARRLDEAANQPLLALDVDPIPGMAGAVAQEVLALT